MRPARIALVAAVVMPFSLLSAQQPAAPAGVHHAAVVTTDVVYGHKAGMALTFDVYRPHAQRRSGDLGAERRLAVWLGFTAAVPGAA